MVLVALALPTAMLLVLSAAHILDMRLGGVFAPSFADFVGRTNPYPPPPIT